MTIYAIRIHPLPIVPADDLIWLLNKYLPDVTTEFNPVTLAASVIPAGILNALNGVVSELEITYTSSNNLYRIIFYNNRHRSICDVQFNGVVNANGPGTIAFCLLCKVY